MNIYVIDLAKKSEFPLYLDMKRTQCTLTQAQTHEKGVGDTQDIRRLRKKHVPLSRQHLLQSQRIPAQSTTMRY